jgi:hypothetical protein
VAAADDDRLSLDEERRGGGDMDATKGARANALRRELTTSVDVVTTVPPAVVYDVLADLRTHLAWAGERQGATSRLTAIEAPDGPADVGTEFRTTGLDPMGTFRDTSVVTEATRAEVFEFVTEARLETKRGAMVEWTNVHRYELRSTAEGTSIRYTIRVVRVSELPGMLRTMGMPVLSGLVMKAARRLAERGVRNLVALAEERRTSAGS